MKITGMSMTILHPSMGDRGLKGWHKTVYTVPLTTDAEIAVAYVAAAKVLRHGSHIVAVEIHRDYPQGTEPLVPDDSWTRLYAAYESAPVQYVNNEDGDWDRHDYVQDGPNAQPFCCQCRDSLASVTASIGCECQCHNENHMVIDGVDTCTYTWPNGDICARPYPHTGDHIGGSF